MSDTPRPPDLEPRTLAEGAGLPVRAAREALTVRRVFGEPYQVGEVTLVPVARVRGGGGMGFGSGPGTESEPAVRPAPDATPSTSPGRGDEGAGGGFAVSARPAGVYVVTGDRVRWEPAVDLARVILGGELLGALAVVAMAWSWTRRRT